MTIPPPLGNHSTPKERADEIKSWKPGPCPPRRAQKHVILQHAYSADNATTKPPKQFVKFLTALISPASQTTQIRTKQTLLHNFPKTTTTFNSCWGNDAVDSKQPICFHKQTVFIYTTYLMIPMPWTNYFHPCHFNQTIFRRKKSTLPQGCRWTCRQQWVESLDFMFQIWGNPWLDLRDPT